MALLLGAIVASSEFRHATATLTYLACPSRPRVLIAKALAAALAGTAMGAIGAGTTFGVAMAFIAGRHDSLVLAAGTMVRYGLGAMLGAALLGALGVAVGSLIRSQIAVAVGAVVWAFFVESIVGGFSTPWSRTCPSPPAPRWPEPGSAAEASGTPGRRAPPHCPSPPRPPW